MNAMRWALALAAAAAFVTNPQRAVRRLQAGDALDDVRFAGTRRLYGEAATTTLRGASAMVVGVGGVGSWAAEAIARTGVGRLILVDLDEVCVSNTNRQLVALSSTVGKSKVEVLRERLTDINPNAVVECVPDFVGEENADAILDAAKVDVVVDCIDNANDKVALLRACDAREQAIVVCGAAGGRRDPTAVRVRPGDVRGARTGDALLRATRKQWRRARRAAGLDGEIREARVVSVYSDERPPAKAEVRTGACDMGLGSSVFATAAFGLAAGAAAVDVLIADGSVAAVEHDVLIADSAARDDTAGANAVLAGVDNGEDDAWEEADCPCSDFGLAARSRPPQKIRWRGGSGGDDGAERGAGHEPPQGDHPLPRLGHADHQAPLPRGQGARKGGARRGERDAVVRLAEQCASRELEPWTAAQRLTRCSGPLPVPTAQSTRTRMPRSSTA